MHRGTRTSSSTNKQNVQLIAARGQRSRKESKATKAATFETEPMKRVRAVRDRRVAGTPIFCRVLLVMLSAIAVVGALNAAATQLQAATPAPSTAIMPERSHEIIQSPEEAMAQDAAEYARRYNVSLNIAVRRLRAQQDSVGITDELETTFRDRLAGIFIEHEPAFRIVVRLTGSDQVPDRTVVLEGMNIPIVFQMGAPATRDRILAAIEQHQADIRATVSTPPGMGVDPKNGMLAVLVRARDVEQGDAKHLAENLSVVAGVPVEIRSWNEIARNLEVEGGGRAVGLDGAGDPRQVVCTTGFVVTDGQHYGISTAAHCPDTLDYVSQGQSRIALDMIGAWGERYQDVQIHSVPAPAPPFFRAGPSTGVARPVFTWRNRESTRVGDFVCHRGEGSGYSCAEVEFVDFAPPGDLCAGPCMPAWVAVQGPGCRSGDSGGPVFSGTIAFGILKGASYTADGVCRLYYYMSTDYLPPGWTLFHR